MPSRLIITVKNPNNSKVKKLKDKVFKNVVENVKPAKPLSNMGAKAPTAKAAKKAAAAKPAKAKTRKS